MDIVHFKKAASSKQSRSSATYEVLRKDHKAHIVQINTQPKRYEHRQYPSVLSGPVARIKESMTVIFYNFISNPINDDVF